VSDTTGQSFRTTSDRSGFVPWCAGAAFVGAAVLVVGLVTAVQALTVLAAMAVAFCLVMLLVSASTFGVVTVEGGVVDHQRWTRRHVRLPIDHDLRGLLAPYLSALPHAPNNRRLVLRRGTRGPRITLTESSWRLRELRLLAAATGADVSDDVGDARDWQRRAPGLIAWWERHWIASIIGLVVAFWVVVIAVIVLVDELF